MPGVGQAATVPIEVKRYNPVEKLAAIDNWIASESGAGRIKKLKNRLLGLSDTEIETSAFLRTAQKEILGTEQLLRTEGKIKKHASACPPP